MVGLLPEVSATARLRAALGLRGGAGEAPALGYDAGVQIEPFRGQTGAYHYPSKQLLDDQV